MKLAQAKYHGSPLIADINMGMIQPDFEIAPDKMGCFVRKSEGH